MALTRDRALIIEILSNLYILYILDACISINFCKKNLKTELNFMSMIKHVIFYYILTFFQFRLAFLRNPKKNKIKKFDDLAKMEQKSNFSIKIPKKY